METFSTAQIGTLGGPIENISGGHNYQFFNIGNLLGSGPVEIKEIYAEAVVRIGTFSSSGIGASVNIEGCYLAFGDYITGVTPVAMVESVGTPININFSRCLLTQTSRVGMLVHGQANVTVDGGAWSGANFLTQFNEVGLQIAANYTGGMFVGSAQSFPQSSANGASDVAGALRWGLPTNAAALTNPTTYSSQVMGPDVDFFDYPNRGLFTQATTGFVDQQQKRWQFAAGLSINPNIGFATGLNCGVCSTFTNDILTFTYLGANQGLGPQYKINIGDMLMHKATGTLFVVTAVGGVDGSGNYPITARQQNNLSLDTNGVFVSNLLDAMYRSPPGSLTGVTYLIHTGGGLVASTPGGIYIPQQVYFGDFISGSTAVTNIGGDQSLTNSTAAASLDTFVKNSDNIYSFPYYTDPAVLWPYAAPVQTVLSSVTNGSGGTGHLTLGTAAVLTGRFPILPLPVAGAGFIRTQLPISTVAGLPSCSATLKGLRGFVTDQNTAVAYHGAVTGSGATQQSVTCDGTNWYQD